MKKNVAAVLAVAGALVMVGCEEKKPATTPTSGTGTGAGLLDKAKEAGDKAAGAVGDAAKAATDKAKDAKDAVEHTADKAKDAVAGAADKAKEGAAGMADAVLAKAKDQGKAYLDQLTGATTKLTGITTPAQATEAKPAIEEMATKFNGASDLVNKLPADIKAKVMDAMKGPLEPAVKGFKDQIARLTGNADINKILGDTLKKFSLAQ
jgi:hypothetical protein